MALSRTISGTFRHWTPCGVSGVRDALDKNTLHSLTIDSSALEVPAVETSS